MNAPLYFTPKKEFNNILNINDSIFEFLIEDNIFENERIFIFEFPENYYFNLNYFYKQIENGIYKDFKMDLSSNGSKRITVIL